MRPFDLPGRSPVIAENGMAATSHPLATQTALKVLQEGGNAVDAALAASATLCVVEPHMTGIGGDCFAILAEPDGAVHALNGSGRAAAGVDAARLRAEAGTAMPQTGAHTVTVPGAVDAWEKLAVRFGTLPFHRLFADAIRYGEEGFAVHARVARDWARHADALAQDEGGRLHWLKEGRAPRHGDRHRAPALAATLRAIAAGGARAFYEGPVAAEIAATVRAKGGTLDEADLAAVQAEWVEPIAAPYAGHEVLELPPNGQGITALILLRLLDALDARRYGPDTLERWHLEIEAGRLAYSVRDLMVGDADAMAADARRLLEDDNFIALLAAQFMPDQRNPSIALPQLPSASTVYLSIVDRDRRAVSFINSLYSSFGSKIVTPRGGFALQNRGACFTLEEGHPNEFGPRKRPMSTIIPALALLDGQAAISFGVMGGAYQPMGHAHVLSNMLDHAMDPQEAIDHPRLFWSEDDGVLEAERGIPGAVREGLVSLGHSVRAAESPHGGAQMVHIDREEGFLIGASDPRKDGCAMGW